MREFKQVPRYLVPSLLIVLLVASGSTAFVIYNINNESKVAPDVNVGVAFCGNTTAEAKLLIDRVKSYTNLFILDVAGNPINRNQTMIEEIGDYAVSDGLKIIINMGFNTSSHESPLNWFWNQSSLDGIKQRWDERWGSMFLGIYYGDEPGGIQLDGDWNLFFSHLDSLSQNRSNATSSVPTVYANAIQSLIGIQKKIQAANGSAPADYNAEANFFVNDVVRDDPGFSSLKKTGFTTFTSDYGLYWFDYLGGYDVMLTQIGWNCSLAQQLDLVKGAAHMQNKEWGAIVTWKYGDWPYLDTGDQIYNQMMTAYKAGANYIVLFNYPILDNNPYGLMEDEHFLALQRFWNDAAHTQKTDSANGASFAEAAMVLPNNYGWGMRRPDDVIWGFYGPDNITIPLATSMSKLLAQYGTRLDIIYDDPAYPIQKGSYQKIYYWTSTV
jgi:hypothetical protein